MTKNLSVFIFGLMFLFTGKVSAQATGTFIVADNGPMMTSCQDTLITLAHIFEQRGIRDLNDPNDDISMYRILRLDGSLITSDELESFLFSAYPTVYVEKKNTPMTGHNGVVIHTSIVTPPTELFDTDTLKYVVDRGARQKIVVDFFAHINMWSSGKDVLPLQDRIFFADLSAGTEVPFSQNPDWSNLAEGTYRFRYFVSVCTADDLLEDTLYVKIEESLCHNIEIRDIPSICLDQTMNIQPYIYLDGQPATSAELADMTFWDRSNFLDQASGLQLDPQAIDFTSMYNRVDHYPMIEIAYQPNTDLGTCQKFNYMFGTRVPAKFISTDLIMVKDNSGTARPYMVDGTYYSFNNIFNTNVLEELYLNYYDIYNGTTFDYFSDSEFQIPAPGDELPPGDYYVVATNPDCSNDSTAFSIHIENRDFNIAWMSAQNMGTGYYTFTAPMYAGATYSWIVWGGSIVDGLNTDQITVYYSENAAQAVSVSCTITLPAARMASGDGELNSALYFIKDTDGTLDDMNPGIHTGTWAGTSAKLYSVYPNPSEGKIMISGEGEMDLKICNMLGQVVYEEINHKAGTQIDINGDGPHVILLEQNGRREVLMVMLK